MKLKHVETTTAQQIENHQHQDIIYQLKSIEANIVNSISNLNTRPSSHPDPHQNPQ